MNYLKQPKHLLLVIVALSVLVRLVAGLFLGNEVVNLPGTNDQLSYHHLAQRLINGFGFSFAEPWWPMTQPDEPTAHWSFLYTFYMTAVYKLFGVNPLVARLIQLLIVGVLQPYLVYLLGQRLFNEWVGLAAALFTAVYFYFIYYAATLMTEPFYITAILAGLYQTIRMADAREKIQLKDALLLGLILGMTVLLRQLYLLVIPFQLLWLAWARYKQHGRLPIIQLGVATAVVVACILPFTYYNYQRFDRFVLLNTNAGYAFYFGNHPTYGTEFIPILYDYIALIPESLLQERLDEAALDQELLSRGMGFIFDDPVRYIRLSLSRIPAYFMFWPSADSGLLSNLSRMGSFGIMLPFMLYGMWKTVRAQWSWAIFQTPYFLLLLFGLVYTAVHLLTWALIRYRLPVDAVFLLFAGVAAVDLVRRFAPHWLPESAATNR